MAGLRGRLGPWDDLATARTGARTHRHMRHGSMDWTVGTFWTMGNDALATGDRLWTAWTPGTDWRPLRPRGPIHGIMPHESVSPRPSSRRMSPRSGRSAESAKHTSPGQAR